jgi:hypothetical protein
MLAEVFNPTDIKKNFLDAFYAGQAHRGCSASLVAAR